MVLGTLLSTALLAELARAGLITRTHGHVAPTDLTLDDIAERHRLNEEKTTRVHQHRAARARWREWLSTRQNPPHRPEIPTPPAPRAIPVHYGPHPDDQEHYLSIVLATGPPPGKLTTI